MFNVFNERMVSAFPLSIGTSLAFESIFEGRQDPYDPERIIPNKIKMSDYTDFLINVDTLIRNLLGSIKAEDLDKVSKDMALETIKQELETIRDIMFIEGSNTANLTFYARDYNKTHRLFSNRFTKFREPVTQRQKFVYDIHVEVLRLLREDSKELILQCGEHIVDRGTGTSLIITHHAVDLLEANRFKDLHLLESNTGELKKKDKWYTKYYAGNTLTNIPFQRKLMFVFGDKELLHPQPMKVRKNVIDIANNLKWSSVTTEAKVNHDIEYHMADRFFAEEFKKI